MGLQTLRNRTLSVILSVCMIMSLCPLTANAEDTPLVIDPAHAYVVDGSSYAALEEALAAVSSGGAIILQKDANPSVKDTIKIEKDVTFDLTNGNLSIRKSAGLALEVKNCTVSIKGGGQMSVTGGVGLHAIKAAVTVHYVTGNQEKGAAAYDGGQITVLGDAKGVAAAAYAYGSGSIIIVGDDAISTGSGGKAIEASTGGHVQAKNAIADGANSYGASATGVGSSVLITGNVKGVEGGVWAQNSAEIEVNGNVIAEGGGSIGAWANTGGKIIVDGSITAENYIKVGSTAKTSADKEPSTGKEGYDTYTDNTSTVWVKSSEASENVCEIGSDGYPTLKAALDAVTDDTPATIDILADINYTAAVQLNNKNITLNLNNHTVNISTTVTAETALIVNGGSLSLTGSGELNISGKSHGVHVNNNGAATVTNAKVSNPALTSGNAAAAYTGGNLTVLGDAVAEGSDDTAVLSTSVAKVTVNGNAIAVKTAVYTGNPLVGGQKPTVHIKGDTVVTGTHADSAGAHAFGGGEITIDGQITVANQDKYIRLNNNYKKKEDALTTTTKAGYLTYSDGTGPYNNSVWVKDDSPPSAAYTVTADAAALTPVAGESEIITLTVKNSSGNTDTTFTGAHDVILSGAHVMTGGINCGFFNSYSIPESGMLTTKVIFTNGVAHRPLSLFKAGSQTISFSVAGVTNPSASVNLTVVPRTPEVMTLTQDITAPAVNGGQFAKQPKLELKDSYSNLCTNDSTTQVTAYKSDGGNWTLTGTTTVTSVNGIVTFADLGASNTGQVTGAQLKFTASNASVETSESSKITLPAPTIPDDVCQIGSTGYATLEAALAAVQNNETITLLQNIDHAQPVVINNKKIILNLGSFNLNIDTSATAASAALTVINTGKVICSGSGKLNVNAPKYAVRAEDGSEIHISGNVAAGQYGVYTTSGGSGNPKVTVDGNVTVTGQGASGEVEAICAGGNAIVTIGGNVTANRTLETQAVTAIYSGGSTVAVGKNVTTQGSGVQVIAGGKVTIEGMLNYNPTGSGTQSYIKVGNDAAGIKTADDFEPSSSKAGYNEFKNGDNIVWVKGAVTTYIVTVNGSYASSTGAGSYAAGDTVNIYAGTLSGYSFDGWTSSDVTITNSADKNISFTMPAKDVTVTANWKYNSGGSNSGSTPKPPSLPPAYNAELKERTGAETTLPVTVNKDGGTAAADIGSVKLALGNTVVTMPSVPGVGTYSVGIPVPELSTPDAQGTLSLNTDNGIITLPSNMLTDVPGISGSKAQISISQSDKKSLPEDVKAVIGNRPLVRLALSIDGKPIDWSNPVAPVTVGIPYDPTPAELKSPESIVIWYIDGAGNAVCIPNGRYNPVTGAVTFSTTHFSHYAVAYNKVSFIDAAVDAWYHKAVSFIAARGITGGTGSGNYSPDAKLTRGEFIVMLMKAYGIEADANPKNNFADAGDTYYTGYLAAAKRLEITTGIGNNMYAPCKEITRQEMFTLLYNTLNVINKLPEGNSGKPLSGFSDADRIASWAKDAMKLLVKTGIIEGYNGMLTPTSTTTRAEMAQVLYNLLSK